MNISLDEGAHGRVIEVAPKERLALTLRSNGSTGFSWDLKSTVTEIESRYLMDPDNRRRVGAGGHQRWVLEAPAEQGSHTVELCYRRPWERGVEPVRVIRFTVKVKG